MRNRRVMVVLAFLAACSMAMAQGPRAGGRHGGDGRHGGPSLAQVEKIEGRTITLKGDTDESQTIELPADASVEEWTSGSQDLLKPGTSILLMGRKGDDGSYEARYILILDEAATQARKSDGDSQHGPTVVQVESSSPLKVKHPDGTVSTVKLDDDTNIECAKSISLDQVQAGKQLMVRRRRGPGGQPQVQGVVLMSDEQANKMRERHQRMMRRRERKGAGNDDKAPADQ